MRHSLYIGKEPNFQKIIIASVVFHLFFITLATVPFKTKDREYKSYYVNIVTPSEVRKPRASLKSKKTGKAESESIRVKTPLKRKTRPISKPKADMTLEPDKTVAREIERLRAISSLAKLKKKTEEGRSGKLDSIRKKIQASPSEDSSPKDISSKSAGIQGIVTSSNKESYNALIFERIRREWIHPEFDRTDLVAIISFHINNSGIISAQKIIKSSGNALFDQTVLKAVKKASPLPPPAVEDDVEIRFHL